VMIVDSSEISKINEVLQTQTPVIKLDQLLVELKN